MIKYVLNAITLYVEKSISALFIRKNKILNGMENGWRVNFITKMKRSDRYLLWMQ